MFSRHRTFATPLRNQASQLRTNVTARAEQQNTWIRRGGSGAHVTARAGKTPGSLQPLSSRSPDATSLLAEAFTHESFDQLFG